MINDYEAFCGKGGGGVGRSNAFSTYLSPISWVIRGFFILNTTTYPLISWSIFPSWHHALSFEWCRTFVWSKEDVLNEYKMCIFLKRRKRMYNICEHECIVYSASHSTCMCNCVCFCPSGAKSKSNKFSFSDLIFSTSCYCSIVTTQRNVGVNNNVRKRFFLNEKKKKQDLDYLKLLFLYAFSTLMKCILLYSTLDSTIWLKNISHFCP